MSVGCYANHRTHAVYMIFTATVLVCGGARDQHAFSYFGEWQSVSHAYTVAILTIDMEME